MKSVVAIVIALISLQSFASQSIDKIIGENDLVAVNADATNIPLKYKGLVNAFGLMSMGCTATHIGNGYVLTAGHCFWAPEVVVKDQACSDTTIEWGIREGGAKPYMTSTCEKIVAAQRSSKYDFAIIKVSPIPDFAIGVELNRKAMPGDVITIFSHPEEMTLRWSKTCNVESQLDAKLPPDSLQHKCDTNPGSSGATIIDANTNKIVAIHDGGRLTSPTDGMNYGTQLTSPDVLDTLKQLGF
ncbi:MAG: trypsin-like peptidase domain-containing protein [Pseudobdellovibrio sp.]